MYEPLRVYADASCYTDPHALGVAIATSTGHWEAHGGPFPDECPASFSGSSHIGELYAVSLAARWITANGATGEVHVLTDSTGALDNLLSWAGGAGKPAGPKGYPMVVDGVPSILGRLAAWVREHRHRVSFTHTKGHNRKSHPLQILADALAGVATKTALGKCDADTAKGRAREAARLAYGRLQGLSDALPDPGKQISRITDWTMFDADGELELLLELAEKTIAVEHHWSDEARLAHSLLRFHDHVRSGGRLPGQWSADRSTDAPFAL